MGKERRLRGRTPIWLNFEDRNDVTLGQARINLRPGSLFDLSVPMCGFTLSQNND